MSAVLNSDRFRHHALLATAMGVVLAFAAIDPPFLLGVGPKWQDPTDDLNAYLIAATYYLNSGWDLPLFAIPAMNYPEGGSIVYNDAVPLAALPAKVIASITGLKVNYLGPWVLLCYALQCVTASRLAFLLGNRSLLATGAFSVFVTSCAAFLLRITHIALCAQFLVFWALLSYLRVREPEPRVARVALPPVLTALLVNPYLFAMVVPLVGAGVLSRWRSPSVRRQLIGTTLLGAGLGIAIIALGGFVPKGVGLGRLGDTGFGHASWNLATLVVPPPEGLWKPLTDGIVRNATGGQYEGESYLGFAPIVLLVCWLWLSPGQALACLRRHGVLLAVLVGFGLFALSHHAYVRSLELWYLPMPGILESVTSVFRVSARFIWPLMYLLLLIPGIYLLTRPSRSWWLGVLVLGAVFQLVELTPSRRFVTTWTSWPSPDLVRLRELKGLLDGHTRVWQYPSWFCGGLGSHAMEQGARRELQIQLIAARAGMPINSVYMSRPLKDCGKERAEAERLVLQPGVAYILSKDVIPTTAALQPLVESPACRDLGWGYVCSQRLAGQQESDPAKTTSKQEDRAAGDQSDLHR